MLKRVLVLAMVAGVMVIAGCGDGAKSGQSGPSSGRVAIVDLDKIAADIGQKSKIEEASKVRDHNLQLRVRVLQQQVQSKLAEELEKIGKRPEQKGAVATDEEKKLLTEWVGKMRGLEQLRLDASNKIRQAIYQQRQVNRSATIAEVNKIRDRIKPLAKSIAAAKGLDVVVTSSSVLSFNDAVNITPEVFQEVNKLLSAGNFPTVTIPEALKVVRKPTTAPAGAPKTPPAPKTP